MNEPQGLNLDPHPADPLTRRPPEYIEVIPGEGGPWFNAVEVCKVLDIPLSSSSWMPPEWARKIEGKDGRKVQAVNPLGIFALCKKAGSGRSVPVENRVTFTNFDDENHTPLQRHQIRAARDLLNALAASYPQKPRGTSRKKPQPISEPVPNEP